MKRIRQLSKIFLGVGAVGGTAVLTLGMDNCFGSSRTRLVAESGEQILPIQYRKWDSNWDLREDKGQRDKPKPKATRHIILIRHGQYNLDGQTDADRTLTELGIQQAKLTGQRLAKLSVNFDYIARSRLTRAVQTAGYIQQSLPGVLLLPEDGLLNEALPIIPEPRINWRPDKNYFVDGPQVEAAFRKYFHRADTDQEKDSYEIIVCHANVIRYFVCRALQLPPEAWLRFSLHHGSLCWVTVRPSGSVHCRSIGEVGFYPPDMMTTS